MYVNLIWIAMKNSFLHLVLCSVMFQDLSFSFSILTVWALLRAASSLAHWPDLGVFPLKRVTIFHFSWVFWSLASISFHAVYLTSLPRSEDFNLPLVFLVRAALGDFSSHCFPRRQACLGFRCRIDFPVGSAPLGPSVPASIKYAARVFLSWLLICAGLCFAPVLICSAWTCSSVPRSVPLGPLFLPPPEICFAAWSLQQKPPAVLASSCLFHSATGDFSFLAWFSVDGQSSAVLVSCALGSRAELILPPKSAGAVFSAAWFHARSAKRTPVLGSKAHAAGQVPVFVLCLCRHPESGLPLRFCCSQFCEDARRWKPVLFLSRWIQGSSFSSSYNAFMMDSWARP
jgi:hypothetical protein